MIRYYTSLPLGYFDSLGDEEALGETSATIVYRLGDDGRDFVILRGETLVEEER